MDEVCFLYFFFIRFCSLLFSCCAFKGGGIKSSNPGGMDGLEVEGDDEIVFLWAKPWAFFDSGLKEFSE